MITAAGMITVIVQMTKGLTEGKAKWQTLLLVSVIGVLVHTLFLLAWDVVFADLNVFKVLLDWLTAWLTASGIYSRYETGNSDKTAVSTIDFNLDQ